MKKFLIFPITIIFLCAIFYAWAWAKDVPAQIGQGQEVLPSVISPEQAAEKIINHGYTLIDAYIKELPNFTCSFPEGIFDFWTENNGQVSISPACIYGKIWRVVGIRYGNGQSAFIVLDGPISGQPGTINETAMADAKRDLSTLLSVEGMTVKIVYKETGKEVFYNLAKEDISKEKAENDFGDFIRLMFSTIKLSKPLEVEKTDVQIISPGISIRISPNSGKENAFVVEGKPIGKRAIRTDIAVGADKTTIEFTADVAEGKVLLKMDSQAILVNRPIEIRDSRAYLETSAGTQEIKVMPGSVVAKLKNISDPKVISIEEKDAQPVYLVQGRKTGKLFSLFPINYSVETAINVQTEATVSLKKPWWSFLVF